MSDDSSLTFQDVPLSPIRKLISKRMLESKTQVPHYYLKIAVDMRAVIACREQMKSESKVKISYNDFIIKAAALALKNHPIVNASFQGDCIRRHQAVHMGMAVALSDGLLVAVIRNCDEKSLPQIAVEARNLAERAQNKKLRGAEVRGSTFTISNLGMFGIEDFTAVINQPEAAILAVGAIQAVPVVEDGKIVIGQQMRLTMSCDHRVIDGAVGAAFLRDLKQLLENPAEWCS